MQPRSSKHRSRLLSGWAMPIYLRNCVRRAMICCIGSCSTRRTFSDLSSALTRAATDVVSGIGLSE